MRMLDLINKDAAVVIARVSKTRCNRQFMPLVLNRDGPPRSKSI